MLSILTPQFLLYSIALINTLVASVVALRNIRSSQNQFFLFAVISVSFWAIGDALVITATSTSSFYSFSKLFNIAPMLAAYFLLLFSIKFPDNKPIPIRNYLALFIPIAVQSSLLIANGGFLVESVNIDLNNPNSFSASTDRFLWYTVSFSAYFGSSYVILFSKLRKFRGKTRLQFVYILLGVLSTSLLAVVSNLILPLFGNTEYIWLGPIFSVLFVVFVSYAIAKHRLFNIGLVIARSLGYALTLTSFALIYFSIGALLTGTVIDTLPTESIVYLVATSTIMALGFRPLKSFFDRFTNTLFYSDSYLTQERINMLSDIAVSEFEIDNLISESTKVLESTLKPSSGIFILLGASGQYYGSYKLSNSPDINPATSLKVLSLQEESVFLADNFDASSDAVNGVSPNAKMYNYLRDHSVAISAKLSTKDEIVGYLLLGSKLSGNIYSKQDVEFLKIAANEMSIAIQNARRFDEIQQFNVRLQEEIEQATRELRQSNAKLKALDTAKDEFITMASHQLRTPLTSVKGYLSMVLEGDTGKISNKQRYLLTSAFTSSQRMVYLIGDLLNVSRLQTGKFVIESSIVDLVDMAASEISQLKETAKSKELNVVFNKPKNFPLIALDETKTRQVMMNFMDNAIYYTPQGGEIQIVLEANSKKVDFKVIDNGIGVPKSEARNLFTKFYRAKNARKARPDGTGLGLFMAKKVIIDQGGAVIFQSKEGKGSTFGFTFPISKVKPPEKLLEKYSIEKSSLKNSSNKPASKSIKNKKSTKKK